MQAFQRFDKDGDGSVSHNELKVSQEGLAHKIDHSDWVELELGSEGHYNHAAN